MCAWLLWAQENKRVAKLKMAHSKIIPILKMHFGAKINVNPLLIAN